MATENRDIKYINRDFGDLRNTLIEFTKTYFPSTYNDFSPSSPGMMFMEMSAYIGDVLSFYLDNQIQETFAQYARQENNLYSLAYMLGYKPKVTGAATVTVDFYQKIPLTGDKPDLTYAVYIPNNAVLSSNVAGASNFLLTSPVDFSISSIKDPTEITSVPPTTPGGPVEYYLLKKTREAISGVVQTKTFTFGTAQRFQTIEINDSNIIQILDVTDSDGNLWYEVPYLAQEMIVDSITNTETDSGEVPYLLQLKKAPRRFVSRFISLNTLQLQFGAGTTTANVEEEVIPNPNNIGSSLTGGTPTSFINTAYDPANFLYTSTYGISPSNTTLTIRYLTGGGVAANIPANSLNNITNLSSITFPSGISGVLAEEIKKSVVINNPIAATGGQNGDTVEELRFNSLAAFGTQLRTVTQADYIIRALSLPSQYGSLAKVYAEPEKLENLLPGESLSATNLYVLAYDNNKNLKAASPSLKNNLKQYLSQYRMVNDSIKIRDGYVINISVGFDIIVLPNFNNNDVLLKCITAVKDYFNIDKWQMNEPIILRDIYILLDKINGVQTVSNVSITNLVGGNYSSWAYDIPGATSGNIVYPSVDPMVFEVKYPDTDIKGRVVSL
jgi:hypothetical protein